MMNLARAGDIAAADSAAAIAEERFGPGDPQGRVRLGTLTTLRWMAAAGQITGLLFVAFVLGYDVMLLPALAAVLPAILLNLALTAVFSPLRRISEGEAAFYLAFDIVQLAVVLFFTGGIENPFALMFLPPVVVAATSLHLGWTALLGTLAVSCITLLGFFHYPVPWMAGQPFMLPPTYVAGIWIALMIGIGFTAIYAYRVAAEGTRMSTALTATQLVLAREQKLSALGSLAAAAAHELGTPLGTIAVIARELERELPKDSPLAEDVRILRAQADRCRDILTRLSHHDATDQPFPHVPLSLLLEEVAQPTRELGVAVHVVTQVEEEPDIRRSPEIVHSLTNLVDNAADFARSRVRIEGLATLREIVIRVMDDGPGFAPDILAKLGEPYVTSRAGRVLPEIGPMPDLAERHDGMGLGFFIAKTLIQRTGGRLLARNAPTGGAVVEAVWPRGAIEVDPRPKVSASA